MTVYVDQLFKYPNGEWCHLITDGYLTELFDLALKIGVRIPWFQYKLGCLLPHFELRPSMRARALAAGAVEATREKVVEVTALWCERRGIKPPIGSVPGTEPPVIEQTPLPATSEHEK